MAPINRRGFVKMFAGLACAALAIKPHVSDAVKWKTHLWYTVGGGKQPLLFTTAMPEMDFAVAIAHIENETNRRMVAMIQQEVDFLNRDLLRGYGIGTPKGILSWQ